jgi:hypothetical protein
MLEKQFSGVKLRLKRVDIPGLGELSRYAFESAFGSYSWDNSTITEATTELRRAFGGAKFVFDTTTSRRFAVDSTLPRARYYKLQRMAIFSAAEDIMRIAMAITASLLGDAHSKANLEAIKLAASSEIERVTLDDVLRLVAQTPKRFQAKGTLAQAWGYE